MRRAVYRYNKLSKERRTMAYDMLDFCIAKMTPRLTGKLEIRIVGKNLLEQEGVYGYCDPDVHDRSPRLFTIEVDNTIDDELFLSTIAHEFVHLKQYARNELISRGSEMLWDRKLYDIEDDSTYMDSPWEIEAYELEQQLLEEFLDAYSTAN